MATSSPRAFRSRAAASCPAGFGLTSTNGLQFHQFGLDSAFKCNGFSASGEYIFRVVDVRRAGRTPFAPWWLLTGDDSTTVQHGAYVQTGYFLPIPGWEDKLEAVARVGWVLAQANDSEDTWEYTLGLNYYIEDKVKLQFDATRVEEAPITDSYSSLANVNDDALVFRVQASGCVLSTADSTFEFANKNLHGGIQNVESFPTDARTDQHGRHGVWFLWCA